MHREIDSAAPSPQATQPMRALVTGASSGIGRATAMRLASQGAHVALVARDQGALSALAQELEALGGRAEVCPADLLSAEARAEVVSQALEALGGLDLLVNAAGVIKSDSVESATLEGWGQLLELNVTAPFHLLQLCLPSLKASRGAVVNVSSVTGVRAFPGVMSYCVSKAALEQMTRCAALELAEAGVRVNSVCPGVVRTELHKRSGMNKEAYAAFLKHSESTHPLGRVGEPEEVAELIDFLGSPRSAWITGVSVPVDGGRHATCAR